MSAAQVIPYQAPAQPVVSAPRGSVLADPDRARMNMKAAEYFAQSDLVPQHYRGKPANCFIAINRAQALGLDEFYFMEKTYVIGGRLGLAAELAIELANNSGRFRGPMKFRLHGDGDERACTAYATLLDGTEVEATVTYQMAVADGWTRNTKWKSLRDHMLCLRAGVFLGRLYAGGAMGGMHTREELEDVAAARRVEPAALAGPVDPDPKPAAIIAPNKSPPKPPLEINLPDGWPPAQFPRTRKGLAEALRFLTDAVIDHNPEVVGMNVGLLDTIAERMPELAEEVAELRSSAAEALAPKEEPEPEDLDEFGLPPVRPDRDVNDTLPTDPPE